MYIIILILIGLLASMIGALVGLGGGVFIVPLLVFFGTELQWVDGITPQIAVGTSSAVLIFIGLSAMLGYGKKSQVDYKNGRVFLIGIIPGALVGSYVNRFFTIDGFYLYFGLFLIFISLLLIIRSRIKPFKIFQNEKYMQRFTDADGTEYQYGFSPLVAIVLTFVVGFSTGLFGIGGGALMTPIMLILLRMPPKVTVGTSMMIVFFAGLASAFGHMLQGNIHYYYLLFLVPAAFIGARLGVNINQVISSQGTVIVLRLVLMGLGLYMVLQTFF